MSTPDSTSKTGMLTPTTSIADIPDALLILVLRQASRRRRNLTRTALVCRKWAEALPEYACNVSIRIWAELDPPGVALLLQQYHFIQKLRFCGASISAHNDDLLKTIAASCPRLQSLKFDELCCVMPGALTATEAGLDAIFSGCPELRHVTLRGDGSLVLSESLGLLTNLETLEVLPMDPLSASGVRMDGSIVERWRARLDDEFSTPQRHRFTSPGPLAVFLASSTPSLPDSLVDLCRLKTLTLECGNIRELPVDFGELPCLKKFWLRCTKLASLPDSICDMKSLKDMYIYSDMLTELPQGFGELSSLTWLDLHTRRLVLLPDSFGDLPKLKVLRLILCRRLAELPQSFGNLPELAELTICGSARLVSLPEGFGRLPSLAKLTIVMCPRLEQLSSGFGDLCSLKNLHLAVLDDLRALPESFAQLHRLEWLSIGLCPRLANLSEGFGNLPALHTLDLESLPALQSQPPSFQPPSSDKRPHFTAKRLFDDIQEALERGFPKVRSREVQFRYYTGPGALSEDGYFF